MAEPKYRFTTDAGLIARLGRELVGKPETALTELVKNAYDADATEVDVVLKKGKTLRDSALVILDNGSGMSLEDLTASFLRVASDTKVRQPRSQRYKRVRAGRKGIGRFAAERLGHRLILDTGSGDSSPSLQLTVDWDEFVPGRELNQVPVHLEAKKPRNQGTTLR
jgi:hypothetical protein